MWIVMKHYTADQDEPGKERRRYEPRFHFETQAEALALSRRLNRAMTTWYALEELPEQRKGPDHEQQRTKAKGAVLVLDAEATRDARYFVEQSHDYSGPMDDVTPVFVALMTAFQQLPNPPADPFEALFRLIRDAS
jgi:hypothetical protein